MNEKFRLLDDLPLASYTGREPDPLLIEFAGTLRANPGMWSEYPKCLSENARYQAGTQIRNGNGPVAFRGAKFEAVVRNKVLYVRYIGK